MGGKYLTEQEASLPTVALLDDSPFEAGLLRSKLGNSFVLKSFQEEASFFEFLRNAHSRLAVIFLDLHLKSRGCQADGLLVLEDLKKSYPQLPIIIYSSAHDPSLMLTALKGGAVDFISKTADDREFVARIVSASNRHKKKDTFLPEFARGIAVGRTMQKIASRLPSLVHSAVRNVHVCAATGCGKEVVADLLAACLGPSVPLVRINCAAISDSLLESEFFGHVKGAFTGAVADRKGYFEMAHHGWLVLDEIGCLSSAAQAAILRAVENQIILPVGARTPKKISVRILSLSNISLEKLVERNEFREDLWQRLTEVNVSIPPLADRPDEIPELIEFFAQNLKPGRTFWPSPPLVRILAAFPWSRGNVRELRNGLRAMTENAVDACLTPALIPQEIIERYRDCLNESWRQQKLLFGDAVQPQKHSLNSGQDKEAGLKIQVPEDKFPFAYESFLQQYLSHFQSKFNFKSLREFSRVTGISRATLSKKMPGFLNEERVDEQRESR